VGSIRHREPNRMMLGDTINTSSVERYL
jgi:hypothetical protein